MSQDEARKLLDQYLSGDCTAEEKEKVEQWIAGVGKQSNEWTALAPDDQKKYLQAMYQEVLHKMHAGDKQGSENKGTRMPKRARPITWLAAASVALVAACSAIFILTHTPASHKTAAYITAATATCQMMEITLPDSTHVWLNA